MDARFRGVRIVSCLRQAIRFKGHGVFSTIAGATNAVAIPVDWPMVIGLCLGTMAVLGCPSGAAVGCWAVLMGHLAGGPLRVL
jgi:hypothetical protein